MNWATRRAVLRLLSLTRLRTLQSGFPNAFETRYASIFLPLATMAQSNG